LKFTFCKIKAINTKFSNNHDLSSDVEAVSQIPIVAQLLDVICGTTGMGFSAIARVTEDRWITCTANNNNPLNLKSGDELKIETTICDQVRRSDKAVFIDEVNENIIYKDHPIPKMYGFQSYVSVPIYRQDGSFFGTLCAIGKKPAKVSTPEVKGMFQLFSNLISFHLQAVEEMKATNAKLEEELNTSKLREQFIGILGHDLKNPIATIRMSSDILLKFAKEELVQRQAKMIKSTSFRMEGLIDNILDFAREHLGEGIIISKNGDSDSLKKALEQVIKEIKTISPERQIDVTIDLNEEVNGDKNRIGQLFSNLLANADTHGDDIHPIKVTAISGNGEFRLSVKNSGKKIPKESIPQLFQPFYRSETITGKEGLGLGLFISSEIAKAHNGYINVDSTNESTEITFIMPLN